MKIDREDLRIACLVTMTGRALPPSIGWFQLKRLELSCISEGGAPRRRMRSGHRFRTTQVPRRRREHDADDATTQDTRSESDTMMTPLRAIVPESDGAFCTGATVEGP